jgi:hypothetical protein
MEQDMPFERLAERGGGTVANAVADHEEYRSHHRPSSHTAAPDHFDIPMLVQTAAIVKIDP